MMISGGMKVNYFTQIACQIWSTLTQSPISTTPWKG